MLSYLIVIIRPKQLENRLQTDKKLTDMKTYRWTQKRRKTLKNQHCLLSMLVLQIEYLYYPLNVECHLKGFTVASLYKIKIIIMAILLLTRQFSFLLDIRKKIDWNSPKTWKICKCWFACRKNIKGLLLYRVSYFANSIWRKFSANGDISSLT